MLVLAALLHWGPCPAETQGGVPDTALISIIIDDLGYRLRDGERALALPGPLTFSFLPHTPHAHRLATLAHARGREIMLHLPMEAVNGNAPGPGGLTWEMGRSELIDTVRTNLASIPFVKGVSNHMGSRLTREPERMGWLMQALKPGDDLYFVDSRTTTETVAGRVAAENGIATLTRDVFLDSEASRLSIATQLSRLVAVARRQGTAVGIGHPYPETLQVLEDQLPALQTQGIRLVPVSQLLRDRERQPQWQPFLSHSPKDAKSSRPSPLSTCCAEPASRL